jgi:hypothetical protein
MSGQRKKAKSAPARPVGRPRKTAVQPVTHRSRRAVEKPKQPRVSRQRLALRDIVEEIVVSPLRDIADRLTAVEDLIRQNGGAFREDAHAVRGQGDEGVPLVEHVFED